MAGESYSKTEKAALDAGFSAAEIERAIVLIGNAAKKMNESRLLPGTLVLLLSHATGLSQREVKKVIDALSDLERRYLKPAKKDT